MAEPDEPSPKPTSVGAGDPPGRPLDRRRALQLLIGGSSVSVAALLGVPVAGYLRPLDDAERQASFEMAPGELAPWEGRLVAVGGRPVILVNTDDGYAAVSAVCTHLGCIVKWKRARRQFFCPCHGGRFDVTGRVLGGPAPRPLDRLEVEEDEETVRVRPV